jgi:hypothetical protein
VRSGRGQHRVYEHVSNATRRQGEQNRRLAYTDTCTTLKSGSFGADRGVSRPLCTAWPIKPFDVYSADGHASPARTVCRKKRRKTLSLMYWVPGGLLCISGTNVSHPTDQSERRTSTPPLIPGRHFTPLNSFLLKRREAGDYTLACISRYGAKPVNNLSSHLVKALLVISYTSFSFPSLGFQA